MRRSNPPVGTVLHLAETRSPVAHVPIRMGASRALALQRKRAHEAAMVAWIESPHSRAELLRGVGGSEADRWRHPNVPRDNVGRAFRPRLFRQTGLAQPLFVSCDVSRPPVRSHPIPQIGHAQRRVEMPQPCQGFLRLLQQPGKPAACGGDRGVLATLSRPMTTPRHNDRRRHGRARLRLAC
jgi:hypothetical protein